MAADLVVARELKALQDELAASRKEREAASAARAPSAASATEPVDGVEDEELGAQLRELAREVTTFIEEAEHAICAHPTQSFVGALLLGIMVGRLLGTR